MRLFLASISAFILIFSTFISALPGFARQLVIFKSHDYISRSYEVQHFVDTLNLEAGQLELPLTMTIYNGSAETPSFKWFRITINGVLVASEQDLRGKEVAAKNVTGIIQGSNLQILIEAGGVPGANLWFALSSEQMALSGTEPQEVTPGETFKIRGENIPSTPDLLSINIGGTPVRAISASAESIVVQMPATMPVGQKEIQVRTRNQVSNPVPIVVCSRPVPEILSIDCWMAPPGGTINISGRNFSNNAVENKVYFGKVEGQVSSASSNQLSVIVPQWSYGPSQLNIPVSVTVNGIRSGNTYPFDIGPSYHGAIPQFGQR